MKRKEYESFIEKVEIFKYLEVSVANVNWAQDRILLQYYEKMSLSDAFLPRNFRQGDLIIKQVRVQQQHYEL